MAPAVFTWWLIVNLLVLLALLTPYSLSRETWGGINNLDPECRHDRGLGDPDCPVFNDTQSHPCPQVPFGQRNNTKVVISLNGREVLSPQDPRIPNTKKDWDFSSAADVILHRMEVGSLESCLQFYLRTLGFRHCAEECDSTLFCL